MFGSHLSIAGSMANALREAKRLKMDCVQVFTKNQRQWRVPPLTAQQVSEWREELANLGWARNEKSARSRKPKAESRQPVRVVSHNTYLINMASPDAEMWEKSVTLQRVEVERCEELEIPCCVAHPGAHLGECPQAGAARALDGKITRDERAGLNRIVKALNRIHRELKGYRTVTCLETTVGSGSNLGYAFEQLAYVRERVRQPERVAYCFDTCHVTAAGYDMTTDERAAAVLECFDAVCGLDNVKVFHFNDSVGAVGSRKDRHAHIGEGKCGPSCFRSILNLPFIDSVPKILETPKETNEQGVPMDVVNIRRLKRLIHTGSRRPAQRARERA